MSLFSLLAQTARRYSDRGAIFLGEQQMLSFADLEDRALRLAASLLGLGVPGDRVLIASKNCVEYPEIMFAAWAAGMVIVPVNAKLHAREIVQIMEDAKPMFAFLSKNIARDLIALGNAGTGVEQIIIGSTAYEAMFLPTPATPAQVDTNALAWLFYTSGTTGRSKGAMLSHRNLQAMTIAHLADIDCADADTTLLHAAPMSHGSGLYILPYISRGARQVIPRSGGYDPGEFMSLCAIHPRIVAFLAPTMVQRLRLEVEAHTPPINNLDLIIYGGGPMYVDELQRSRAALGPVFAQIYGQGEAPMTITGLSRRDHNCQDEAVLGSVGWPRSGVEVAILDEEDRPVPPGTIGEIACQGDAVMQGYWTNPSATEAALRNGWLHTGDLGMMNIDGSITLHDRSKDVIISGGTNVYPREVEEALLRHDAVAEVAVVGMPDPEWGENIVAFIVTRDGMPVGEQELGEHCLSWIARFKRPKAYRFVTELPKNSYGKVLKRDLVSQI